MPSIQVLICIVNSPHPFQHKDFLVRHAFSTTLPLNPIQSSPKLVLTSASNKEKSYKRTNEIKGLLDVGHVVGAVFSDLKKAFITVYHNVLKCKLVPVPVFHSSQWFDNYLRARVQCVGVKGEKIQLLHQHGDTAGVGCRSTAFQYALQPPT